MKRWIATSTIAAVAILCLATFAIAQHGPGRGPHGGPGMGGPGGMFGLFSFEHLKARLKLTPEQSTQIERVGQAERTRAMQQFASGADDRQALIKEIFRDNPNQSEINRRVQVMLQQHAQMLNDAVATGLEINKVLTPEQRAEMQKIADEHAQAMQNMRQRMEQRRQQQGTDRQP